MQDDSINNQEIIKHVVQDLIREKRSDRRWKNIRFFIILAIFVLVVALMIMESHGPQLVTDDSGHGYVSLVRLNGEIGPGQDFSAENVLPILKDAFSDKDAKGVVLDINSGGGTPVQASIIHDAIIQLKNKYHKKVIVVGEDVMASGAYFVAVAGDKIYVNPSSITGSVGVIMKEFGFPDLIKKIGVERRVYISGVNKDRLDEFMPQNPSDVQKINDVIGEIHGNFIDAVKEGRKGKLVGDPAVLFSGDFWPGKTAMKLGFVDGLGNLSDVVHNEFQASGYRDYTQEPSVYRNLIGQFGMSFEKAISSSNDSKVYEKI